MASSDTGRSHRLVQILCGLAAIALVVLLVRAFKAVPPQMGTDEAAIRNRRCCSSRHSPAGIANGSTIAKTGCSDALRKAGQLPGKAADHLDTVMQQALLLRRMGTPAAKRLYDFMYRQRRESP